MADFVELFSPWKNIPLGTRLFRFQLVLNLFDVEIQYDYTICPLPYSVQSNGVITTEQPVEDSWTDHQLKKIACNSKLKNLKKISIGLADLPTSQLSVGLTDRHPNLIHATENHN